MPAIAATGCSSPRSGRAGCCPARSAGRSGAIGDVYPKLDWAPRALRAKTTLQALGQGSGLAYADAVGVTPPALRRRIFTAPLHGHDAEERYVRAMAEAPARDALSRAQYADLKIWLPGDILTKVDRASMAVSLEAREPLLDHRLVEFAARLPARMRLRGGTGKWLIKRALEERLPRDILHRPKMGFVTPISAWFRGPLAERGGADRAWLGAGRDRLVRRRRDRTASPRRTAPAGPSMAGCSGSC